jgi:hypothetical protein
MLTLENIEREMQTTDLSPHTLADYRVYLAALFSLRAAEMQGILAVKPSYWNKIRPHKNSDKAADREWQARSACAVRTAVDEMCACGLRCRTSRLSRRNAEASKEGS